MITIREIILMLLSLQAMIGFLFLLSVAGCMVAKRYMHVVLIIFAAFTILHVVSNSPSNVERC